MYMVPGAYENFFEVPTIVESLCNPETRPTADAVVY